MRTITTKRAALALALAGSMLLAACGGGDDEVGPPTSTTTAVELVPGTNIPRSALASVSAFVAYIESVLNGTDETSEPFALGDITPPTSETD